MHELKYRNLDSNDATMYPFNLDKLPDNCPLCNTVQEPLYICGYKTQNNIELIFKCNKSGCKHLFISLVSLIPHTSQHYVKHSYPKKPTKKVFENEIIEISPLFAEIYNQAKEAEDTDLYHIAGMGYRKSLEFLVKDYLINFKEEDEQAIKKEFLGTCIKKYLSSNIKQIAERATWLGNDETHYHRVWENKDIKDLKILIGLTVHYVLSEIQTKKYLLEMER